MIKSFSQRLITNVCEKLFLFVFGKIIFFIFAVRFINKASVEMAGCIYLKTNELYYSDGKVQSDGTLRLRMFECDLPFWSTDSLFFNEIYGL